MILYVNCCPRSESRTDELAKALLSKLGEYTELKLYETDLQPLNEERLIKRAKLIEKSDYSDPIFDYAKQFAQADKIVISAPFWDLSFPSMLKIYIENIYAMGIVTKLSENGFPIGLCKADKLYYVTTSGGQLNEIYGFNYVKFLMQNCFGIKNVELVKAEMLDIYGNNPQELLEKAKEIVLKS